jgi:poly(A) polymerase/tRNA nucleotidyltransferase (CCA-adding enzyme)
MNTPFLDQVRAFLAAREVQGYLVGGYVRDLLLKRPSNDIDIAVPGDAIALTRALANAIGGHFVLLDAANGIARAVAGDHQAYVDIVRMRQDNLEADLAARDFTYNALALPVQADSLRQVVDLFGGAADLRARRVRAVGDSVFQDDPVRMVRAVRFVAQLGHTIEPHTHTLAKRDAPLLARVAAERVRDEFVKILVAPGAWQNLHLLDEMALLSQILPELDALRGVSQPIQHAYDVFTHTLAVADAIEETLIACQAVEGGKRPPGPPHLPLPAAVLGDVAERVRSHVHEIIAADRSRLFTLKLGALLHDIAKPLTKTVDDDGETHFYNHPVEGVAIAEQSLRRLKLSTREIEIVTTMIVHHMRPAQIAAEPKVTNRAVYRFFRDAGAEGVDTLLLSLADHMGARGPRLNPQAWWQHAQFTRLMLEYYYAQPEKGINLPRLVTGNDIMKALKLPAGPQVGEILELVREAQAEGEVRTKPEAIAFARALLQELPNRG